MDLLRRLGRKLREAWQNLKYEFSFEAVFAEFIAVAILVLTAPGIVAIAVETLALNINPQLTTLLTILVAFGFGFTILVLLFLLQEIKGAGHINPAVTAGIWLYSPITLGSTLQAVSNIIAQLAGAIVGSLMLWGITWDRHNLGANSVNARFNEWQAFIGEMFFTAILVSSVLLSLEFQLRHFYVAVGITVFLAHAILIPIDGCSVNPARSFGPGAVGGFEGFRGQWVFYTGPFVGSIIAFVLVLVFRWMRRHYPLLERPPGTEFPRLGLPASE